MPPFAWERPSLSGPDAHGTGSGIAQFQNRRPGIARISVARSTKSLMSVIFLPGIIRRNSGAGIGRTNFMGARDFWMFSAVGRTPTGACNNAPFSEGFLEGFSRLLSRRF